MANLMDLVRELKTLNARKKAGEALPPADEARRKELKAYLRDAIEQQNQSSLEDSAIKDATAHRTGSQRPVPSGSSAPKHAPSASSAPKPVPSASSAHKPVPSASSAPKPTPTASQSSRSLSMADIATAAARKPAATPVAAPFVDDDVIPDPPKRGGAPVAAPFVDDEILPDPPKKQAPAPYVPRKDAFAIDTSKADALIGNAMKSEAVAKVDPLSNRQAHASRAELDDAEALADAAVRANKKRERARDADDAAAQLQATEAVYTPPEANLAFEQYYGSYADEGYAIVDATAAGGAKPIDPRELELAKLDLGAGNSSITITVPPGLAFLDDFAALYAKRILPPPEDEVVVDSADPNLLIPGTRKVTVHLLNGEKRQGAIRVLKRGELGFKLEPLGSGSTEELSMSQCKAVFIHLAANQTPKDVQGRALTVTFADSRSVQGVSDDYQPGAPVFTLVPPAGRGQFERIIVNGAAVRSVG
ncbi:MAG: hypothetical protein IT382_13480 [Deltaproteobacteria bacterium]|nr:hypothetical protein [Deltaproteobacteria bacterium]